MIITRVENELQIVRQADHAVQAGDMATHWGNDTFLVPENSRSVYLAVERHDIGWKEPDGGSLLYNPQTRRPLNFTEVNPRDHVTFYRRGFEQVMADDPYAGLLVGMHWIGLYTGRFGYAPFFTYTIPEDLVSFMDQTIAEQEKSWVDIKRRLWSGQGPLSQFEDQLWRHYEFLQFMDRLSLFFWTQDLRQKATAVMGPLRVHHETVNFTVINHGDFVCTVSPFPFSGAFTTRVAVRKIPDRLYDSPQDLLRALDHAQEETVAVRIQPE